MKYVFMGGVYPKEIEKELFEKAKGHLSFAANKHQWNMIKGIDENSSEPMTIINTYFLPFYPRYAEWKIPTYNWSHVEGAKDVNIGYVNFRGLRNITPTHNIYLALKRYIEQNQGEKIVVFLYTMRYSQMKAVYKLKQEGENFHACLIVPDVPSIIAKYGKRTDIYSRLSTKYNLKSLEKYNAIIDSFVLLSEPMKELVKVGKKPYCIVDGLFSEFEELYLQMPNDGLFRIVYTGSLHREYGICDLLTSFSKLKGEQYKLLIAGAGNAVEEVKKAQSDDRRIEYLGLLNTDEVKALQLTASLLVNPRPIEGIDAKYSFPSKTIEYMLRSRPVLMNRLPGMDKEYENYIFTPTSCGADNFTDAIKYIFSLPQSIRLQKAVEARKFIIENKNHLVQMKKVIDMVSTFEEMQ